VHERILLDEGPAILGRIGPPFFHVATLIYNVIRLRADSVMPPLQVGAGLSYQCQLR
jgi:hypothetical protein